MCTKTHTRVHAYTRPCDGSTRGQWPLCTHPPFLRLHACKPVLFHARACLIPPKSLSYSTQWTLCTHPPFVRLHVCKPVLFHARACLIPRKSLSYSTQWTLCTHPPFLRLHACKPVLFHAKACLIPRKSLSYSTQKNYRYIDGYKDRHRDSMKESANGRLFEKFY